jgi:hypothetical protein
LDFGASHKSLPEPAAEDFFLDATQNLISVGDCVKFTAVFIQKIRNIIP